MAARLNRQPQTVDKQNHAAVAQRHASTASATMTTTAAMKILCSRQSPHGAPVCRWPAAGFVPPAPSIVNFRSSAANPPRLGACHKRGDRVTAGFQNICVFRFCSFLRQSRFAKGSRMRRIDLVAATLEDWTRLTPEQRDRFFKAG